MAFHAAARLDDFWQGEMRGLSLNGTPVLLLHCGKKVLAFEDRCLHKSVRLSEKGQLSEQGILTCTVHGWQYDAKSGQGLNPSRGCLKQFATRIEGGQIFVDTESSEGVQ